MIYAIVGKPGEGKSYTAVKLVKSFLEKGNDVYANVLIDERKLQLRHNKKHKLGTLYYWRSLAQFRYITKGIVIIDEAASYFEARNWARFTIDDRIKFQQHRKQRLDIYLIAQSFGRIESAIRQLVNHVYEMKRINIFGKQLFIKKMFTPEDIDLKTRKPLSTNLFFLDKKIADAYDTEEIINLIKPPSENKFKRMSDLFSDSVRPLGRIESGTFRKGVI